MDWFDRIFGLFFVTFVLFMVGAMVIFGAAATMTFSGYSCRKTAEIVGMEHQHSIATGCYFKVDGIWIAESKLVPAQVNGKTVYVPAQNVRVNLETQAK
jgi:hypothetical protein